MVAAVRGAAVIEEGAAAEWKIKIDHFQTALYIGLEQVIWPLNCPVYQSLSYYCSNSAVANYAAAQDLIH